MAIIFQSTLGRTPDEIINKYYMHTSGLIDINNDGRQDVIAVFTQFPGSVATPIRIYVAMPDGSFRDQTTEFIIGAVPALKVGRELVTGDFNGDGRLDVFIGDHGTDVQPTIGARNVLLLSDSAGRLSDASNRLPTTPDFTHAVAAGDIDNDGDLDIVVGNFVATGEERRPYILLNDGRGNFTQSFKTLPAFELVDNQPLSDNMGSLSLADYNNDGHQDLFIGTWGRLPNRLYLGDGTGSFAVAPRIELPVQKLGGKSANAADIHPIDFDLDGDLDAVISYIGAADNIDDPSSYRNRAVQLLENDGAGRFTDVTALRLPLGVRDDGHIPGQWFPFLEIRDVNRDGLPDIVAKNLNTGGQDITTPTPVLWLNVDGAYFRPITQANVESFNGYQGSPRYPGPFEIVDADGDGGVDLLSFGFRAELLRQVVPFPSDLEGLPYQLSAGGTGRDLLVDRPEAQVFAGGAGVDTASFAGERAQATLGFVAGSAATISLGAAVDLIGSVERLRFADGTLALDVSLPGRGESNAGSAYRLYQAAFDRTPDNGGLAFWIKQLDAGTFTREQMAQGFVAAAEFKAVYGADPSATDLVNGFYNNILGRNPESGGFNFWVSQLEGKPGNRAFVLDNIANSPENQQGLVGVIGQGVWVPGDLLA
jgi:hypothetical protein